MLYSYVTYIQWNVHRAFAMLCKCLKWRIEINIIDIMAKGDVGLSAEDKDFARQGPACKAYAAGMTDNLMPIIYIHVKRHVAKEQGADTMTKYVVSCAESFRRIVRHPMDKIVIVFNLSGFSMKNMDWHSLLTIISILEAYYPETLYKLYIYSAPWIFQGIWKALAPMLDAHVRAKISFANKPADLDLIPSDRLESSMGGDLAEAMEWTPTGEGEKPALMRSDPQRRQYWSQYMQQAKAYEEITRRWVASQGQDDALMEERHFMALKVRATFLSLSSFFFASSMYDRAGIIRDDFALEWTYKQKNQRIIKHVVGEEMSLPTLQKLISSREGHSNTRQDQSKENWKDQHSNATYGAAAGTGVRSQPRSPNDGRHTFGTDLTGSRNVTETPTYGSRGANADIAAGAGAGAATAAAGGAAMMSNGQMSNSRSNLSYLVKTPRSGAGSSSASIFSSSSEDDLFVDADDFSRNQGSFGDTVQNAQGYSEQSEGQAQEGYMDGEDQYEEVPQRDAQGAEDENDEALASNSQRPTNEASGDESRRQRGAPRPMVGENEKLAGFGDLGPEAHDQIAESNEKMREPFDPNQKRAQQSIWSRLNCCSGKNID